MRRRILTDQVLPRSIPQLTSLLFSFERPRPLGSEGFSFFTDSVMVSETVAIVQMTNSTLVGVT